jgi:hypothetical protein
MGLPKRQDITQAAERSVHFKLSSLQPHECLCLLTSD